MMISAQCCVQESRGTLYWNSIGTLMGRLAHAQRRAHTVGFPGALAELGMVQISPSHDSVTLSHQGYDI